MKREVTMKKILVFTLFLCVLASSFATDYDIGGGQKLILKEDGTYEIITSVIDTSVVQGKQYSLDMKRSLDPLIELMVLEDPSIMLLGKDYVASLLEGMIGTEFPAVSLIFISGEKVLLTIEGSSPQEASYRISADNSLFITGADGEETEVGTFSPDFSELRIVVEGVVLHLVCQ